ncbi:hypothetical protein RND71_028191 [Anisodus tanguticus]|uniref:RRM domain-containing protein n=1 Tax=Anisodus tanguticus TaxID=243964 RepID=A0AAE1V1D0_9SOLA|nr:hypothetical protein RND71_028191 [Anisodus tanguticus]
MANAEVEAVDFEPEEDDLMDEDVDASSSPRATIPKLKSAITGGGSSSAPKKTKGRGFREEAAEADRGRNFIGKLSCHAPFGDYIGLVSFEGYAFIEYENFEEAQRVINEKDGAEFLTQTVHVDWAFSRGPFKRRNARRSQIVRIYLAFKLPGQTDTLQLFLQIGPASNELPYAIIGDMQNEIADKTRSRNCQKNERTEWTNIYNTYRRYEYDSDETSDNNLEQFDTENWNSE